MLNIIQSSVLSMIAFLGPLCAEEISLGKSCLHGDGLSKETKGDRAAYSPPADLWRGYFDVSFIYWYASELGLYLGEYGILTDLGAPNMALESFPLFTPLEYHPGFKIGAGATYKEEWTISGEYTWFRGQTELNEAAPANTSAISGQGVWIVDDWFQQITPTAGKSLIGTSIASQWNLAMDLADLDLSRRYHRVSSLTLFPYFGLRAAWIRQKVDVALTQAAASEGGSPLEPQPILSLNRSHSWAIGPRLGCDAHCLLPKGWRLEGDCSASLLATCFTRVSHSETAQSAAVTPGPYQIMERNHYLMSPNAQLGLGIGWETFSSCKKYHFDFSATYDFIEFWNQNAIRRMLDNFWAGIGSPAGDLYFHGLTLNVRLDF